MAREMKHDFVRILAGEECTPFVVSRDLLEYSGFFKTLLSERWLRYSGRGRASRNRDGSDSASEDDLDEEDEEGEENEDDDEERAGTREGEEPLTLSVDCEPRVFRYLLSLLRYHSVQALPKMTQEEIFSLKKEADFYGIDLDDTPFSTFAGEFAESSMEEMKISSRFADPTLLVTVRDVADGFCCDACGGAEWGVSFYLRYAFCIKCGSEPGDPGLVGNILVAALRASSLMQSHHLRMEAYSKGESVILGELGLPVFQLDEFAATYEPTMLVTVTVPSCYCECLASNPRWCVSLHYRHVVCVSCKKKLAHPRMLAAIFLAAASSAKHTPQIHLERYRSKQ